MGYRKDIKNNITEIKRQVDDLAKKRDFSIADPLFARTVGYPTWTGEDVDECKSLNISAVFRAVSIIAGSIGSLNLSAVVTDDQGRTYEKTSWIDNPCGDGSDVSIPYMTQFEWVETIVAHMVLHGESFLWILRNNVGAITAAVPVHPAFVHVEPDEHAPGQRIYTVEQDTGQPLKAVPFGFATDEQNEIMHIPGLSMRGLRGESVIGHARNSMGIAIAGEKSAGTFMKNGPQHTVVITPNEDLEEDEATIVADSVGGSIGGAENAGKSVVLNRAFTISTLTMTYADAQFLESRVFQIEEIARWFGLPPHLLGQTEKQTSWGTGVAEQNMGLHRYVLSPITTRIQQRLTQMLGKKIKAEFDYKAFLKPSPADEINLIISEVNNGLLTPNEGRALMNLPPIPGNDELRLPPGSTPPTEGANMNANQQDNSQTTQ